MWMCLSESESFETKLTEKKRNETREREREKNESENWKTSMKIKSN